MDAPAYFLNLKRCLKKGILDKLDFFYLWEIVTVSLKNSVKSQYTIFLLKLFFEPLFFLHGLPFKSFKICITSVFPVVYDEFVNLSICFHYDFGSRRKYLKNLQEKKKIKKTN